MFSLFKRYELASGAKLIAEKCHGLLFGSWKHLENLLVKLQWLSESYCVLVCRLANVGLENCVSESRSSRRFSRHGSPDICLTTALC